MICNKFGFLIRSKAVTNANGHHTLDEMVFQVFLEHITWHTAVSERWAVVVCTAHGKWSIIDLKTASTWTEIFYQILSQICISITDYYTSPFLWVVVEQSGLIQNRKALYWARVNSLLYNFINRQWHNTRVVFRTNVPEFAKLKAMKFFCNCTICSCTPLCLIIMFSQHSQWEHT